MIKKIILFVAYGGGHINALLPIIRALSKVPDYNVEVLGLTTAAAPLEKEGIPYFGFRHLINEVDELAHAWGRKLADHTSHQSVTHEETVAYLGLSYMDLINRLGEEEAQRLYADKGRQAFLPLSVMEKLFERIRPDMVVTTSAPRAEQAAILTAGKMGIPAVCLVDLFASFEIKWIGRKGYANKICVMSDYVKNFIVKSGRKPEEIIVTGNPAFDRLAQPGLQKKGEEFRVQKNWGKSRVILWASQSQPKVHAVTGKAGGPDLSQKIDQVLFKIIQRHPEWRLVIRFHPSETIRADRLPPRVELSPLTEDLPTLLKAVDVIISMTSTVGLEGVLIGTPFIALNNSMYTPDAPFSKMGIAKGVNHLDNLEDALIEVLSGNWYPSKNLPDIGQATNKVIEVIINLLSQNG